MANQYFECKVKFGRMSEEGVIKSVTENYLVEAVSFTEAEVRITKEMEPFVSGGSLLSNVSRKKITELIDSDQEVDDKWFRSKINLITLDEEKGKEKLTGTIHYVKASDIKRAVERLIENMKGTMCNYNIFSVTETKILDVFEYKIPELEDVAKE